MADLFLYMLPGLITEPEKVKEYTRSILESGDFVEKKGPIDKALEYISNLKVVKDILELLRNLLRVLLEVGSSPVGQVVLGLILLIFFIALVVFLVSTIKKRIKVNVADSKSGSIEEREESLNPVDREDVAETYAKRGDYIKAIRHLYAALLLYLDVMGVMNFKPSRTNRENQKLIGRLESEEINRGFAGLSQIFERKIYALELCTYQDYDVFKRNYEICREGVKSLGE